MWGLADSVLERINTENYHKNIVQDWKLLFLPHLIGLAGGPFRAYINQYAMSQPGDLAASVQV